MSTKTLNPAVTLERPARLSRTNTTVSVVEDVDIVITCVPEKLIASLYSQPEIIEPQRKPSLLRSLGNKYKNFSDVKRGAHVRYVRMPRDEYVRFWARDDKGRYCGIEPEHSPEALELLKLRLADEHMQNQGRKAIAQQQWRPIKERSGWAHVDVGYIGAPC